MIRNVSAPVIWRKALWDGLHAAGDHSSAPLASSLSEVATRQLRDLTENLSDQGVTFYEVQTPSRWRRWLGAEPTWNRLDANTVADHILQSHGTFPNLYMTGNRYEPVAPVSNGEDLQALEGFVLTGHVEALKWSAEASEIRQICQGDIRRGQQMDVSPYNAYKAVTTSLDPPLAAGLWQVPLHDLEDVRAWGVEHLGQNVSTLSHPDLWKGLDALYQRGYFSHQVQADKVPWYHDLCDGKPIEISMGGVPLGQVTPAQVLDFSSAPLPIRQAAGLLQDITAFDATHGLEPSEASSLLEHAYRSPLLPPESAWNVHKTMLTEAMTPHTTTYDDGIGFVSEPYGALATANQRYDRFVKLAETVLGVATPESPEVRLGILMALLDVESITGRDGSAGSAAPGSPGRALQDYQLVRDNLPPGDTLQDGSLVLGALLGVLPAKVSWEDVAATFLGLQQATRDGKLALGDRMAAVKLLGAQVKAGKPLAEAREAVLVKPKPAAGISEEGDHVFIGSLKV
ncbi:MAG: hypothetical protein ACYCW6_01460 [Candidatus Xenobia bacterium]